MRKTLLILSLSLLLTGCNILNINEHINNLEDKVSTQVETTSNTIKEQATHTVDGFNSEVNGFEQQLSKEMSQIDNLNTDDNQNDVDYNSDVSTYDNSVLPYSVVNKNIPFFTPDELTTNEFETYSELDNLGRCGVAYANVCKNIMPTEKRGEIGSIKPSGWCQNKYPEAIKESPSYLYNRCHLIAFELAGENANKKNLITGTRYMNVTGMLPFENKVADYVKKTNHHVLYRCTPIFNDNELVARGVLIEAKSVEDDGCVFCVYCPNVQPGIKIDYLTGENEVGDLSEVEQYPSDTFN